MNIDEYQKLTRETAVYPDDQATNYLTLGLNDEAGEVAGAVKKHKRGDYGTKEMRERVAAEAGDVLWYWVRLLDELDLSAAEVMEHNAEKVLDRKDRDEIKGDGDNR